MSPSPRQASPSDIGLTALGAFFAAGALVAGAAAVALLTPHGLLEPMWRLNPRARENFRAMGTWAVPLMAVVATACALTAVGLSRRARWGHHLAVVLLAVNMLGDVGNAVARGDVRTLLGVPIAGALLWYLLTDRVRGRFAGARRGLARPASTLMKQRTKHGQSGQERS